MVSTPIPTSGPGPATALVLSAIDDSLVFFYTPTDLAEKDILKDRRRMSANRSRRIANSASWNVI